MSPEESKVYTYFALGSARAAWTVFSRAAVIHAVSYK